MEFNIVKEEADSMVFELKGEDASLSSLVCWALLKDAKVEMAAFDLGHPLTGAPKIFIKTKGKAPRKALEDSLELLAGELASIKRAVAKLEE